MIYWAFSGFFSGDGEGGGGCGAMPAVVSRKRYLGAINSPPSALKLVFLCFVEVFARICSVLKLWMIISYKLVFKESHTFISH